MDGQDFLNVLMIIVAIAQFFGGWILKGLWGSIKDAKHKSESNTDRIGRLEVLVAGEYVQRNEFTRVTEKLFTKLDEISNKLSAKADR